VVHLWRRYSQFDGLRNTMADILGPTVPLPKLTSKKIFTRSSVQAVAEHRRPKLEKFLLALLKHSDNAVLTRTLQFFLTATAEDDARLALGLTEEGVTSDDDDDDSDGDAGAKGKGDNSNTGPRRVWAVAAHDFVARAPEELSVAAGVTLEVLERIDSSWLRCTCGGRQGLIPASYVNLQVQGPLLPLTTTLLPVNGGAVKPSSPAEELKLSEEVYVGHLVSVRDTFFPRLRHYVTAGEAKKLFNNWAELVPCSQVLVWFFWVGVSF
jgi:hypothetical protein